MIRIGTRKSPLALIQAQMVKEALVAKGQCVPDQVEVVPMMTTGDQITDRKLMAIGGKGLFTKEIEEALLRGDVHMAVHSMKDVATVGPEGLVIPACLPRDDVRDAWLSPVADHPLRMEAGLRVGSASLRRSSQILHINPHLEIVTLRGNVQTRLRKLDEGEAHGTVLAMAGLNRLGLAHLATHVFSVDEMMPAPAQGAIGIQCRAADTKILELLGQINDPDTKTCIEIERTFLGALDGSCRTPIAALAVLNGDQCTFSGLISDPRGQVILKETMEGPVGKMTERVLDLVSHWFKHNDMNVFREHME